jgi:pyruvate ferredoxin oxidoreductase gamma subunit
MESPKINARQKAYLVPANEIALKTIGRSLGNTALLGAYAAATGDIDLNNLLDAVKKRFSGKMQDANLQAVKQGFDFIKNLKK